jgi:putative Mg2+ transporter-C (MgtC) family protein
MASTMPSETEILLRLLLACVLGGAVGLERELSGQGAGFRTHILVTLGSCLFTLISAYAFQEFLHGPTSGARISFDPSRIAAQVVSGVGFLGGGAILRSGTGVRGLTTAASLWVVAAVGMAAGAGFYGAAGLSTGLAIVSLYGLKLVRRRFLRERRGARTELAIETQIEIDLGEVLRVLEGTGAQVERLHVEQEEETRTVRLVLRVPAERRAEDVATALSRVPGVRDVEWSR